MSYSVEFSPHAEADLVRFFDFLPQRELESACGDLDLPERTLNAIKTGVAFLKTAPFACRKVEQSPFLRELVITFGATGNVALYEIVNDRTVIIGAVRYQREDDYH